MESNKKNATRSYRVQIEQSTPTVRREAQECRGSQAAAVVTEVMLDRQAMAGRASGLASFTVLQSIVHYCCLIVILIIFTC